MSTIWQLEVAGDRRLLRDWGIRNPVLRRVNRGVDALEFVVPSSDVLGADPFAFDTPATLWRGDTRYFSGLFEDCIVGASAGGEGHACRIVGPWQALEDIVYQQPYIVKNPSFAGFLAYLSSRVVLGQDVWGKKISIDQQITNIVGWARFQGGNLFTLSTVDSLNSPPLSEARDISCAAAINRMLDMVPDSVAWFDYSTATPALKIRRRANLSTVSLAIGDANLIRGLSSLRARNEIKARGVVFVFQTTEVNEADGRSYTRETRQSAGVSTGRRVVFATIALGGQGTSTAEAVPSGLASSYYTAVGTLHYSGELVLKERECSGSLLPGHKLNLTGGKTAWETMAAVVQQTEERLETGETVVTLGPPEHLSPQDFVELQRYWQQRPPLSDFAQKQHNGSEGLDDDATEPGIDGFGGGDPTVAEIDREPNAEAGRPATSAQPAKPSGEAVSIPYCVDGVQTEVTVYKAG